MSGDRVLDYSKPKDVFLLSGAGEPALNQQLKAIPTSEYIPTTQRWRIPGHEYAAVDTIATRNGFQFTVAASDAVDHYRQRADGSPDGYDITLDPTGSHYLFLGAKDAKVLSRIHRVTQKGWDAHAKQWKFPLPAVELVQVVLHENLGVTCSPDAQAAMEAADANATSMTEQSHAMDADLTIDGFPVERLFPYQRAAVRYIQNAEYRCIVGDKMRVGKSWPAIAALVAADCFPAVVVAPMGACINWQRMFEDLTPQLKVWIARGGKARPIEGYDVVIVGWQSVAKWGVELRAMKPQSLITDEGHRGKNGKAQRSRAAVALGRAIPAGQPSLLLTGTIVENGYKELENQLKIIGRHEQFGGTSFKSRWAGDDGQRRLHDLLRATCYCRRDRVAATGILDPERSIFAIEGDPKIMAEYAEANENVLDYLAQKAREKAIELGKDPESAAVMAAMRAAGAAHLVAIGVLRQLAARAKIAEVIAYAERWLADTDESLIIFAYHRSVIEGVSAALGCPKIYGGDGAVNRQRVLDGFERHDHRIVVASIPACGEAISLAAASDEIFLEQAWHPSALRQAEDRACHVSKPGAIITADYWATVGTIDYDMLDIIESKRQHVDMVTDGGSADGDKWDSGQSIAGDLIERLTRRGLTRQPHRSAADADAEAWLHARAGRLEGPVIVGDELTFDLVDLPAVVDLPPL